MGKQEYVHLNHEGVGRIDTCIPSRQYFPNETAEYIYTRTYPWLSKLLDLPSSTCSQQPQRNQGAITQPAPSLTDY